MKWTSSKLLDVLNSPEIVKVSSEIAKVAKRKKNIENTECKGLSHTYFTEFFLL